MPEIIPDNNNEEAPKPPSKPVEFARWVQRPRNIPKPPKVQPDDSALRPKGVKLPKTNKVIGTDKPKREKPKKANTANTSIPSYLKPSKAPAPVPVVKETSSLDKLRALVSGYVDNPESVKLEKLSVPTIVALGAGWYLSDTLTRDEKQKYGRQLENEWNRALDRQAEADRQRKLKRMSRSGNPTTYKSAFQKLVNYWEDSANGE